MDGLVTNSLNKWLEQQKYKPSGDVEQILTCQCSLSKSILGVCFKFDNIKMFVDKMEGEFQNSHKLERKIHFRVLEVPQEEISVFKTPESTSIVFVSLIDAEHKHLNQSLVVFAQKTDRGKDLMDRVRQKVIASIVTDKVVDHRVVAALQQKDDDDDGIVEEESKTVPEEKKEESKK